MKKLIALSVLALSASGLIVYSCRKSEDPAKAPLENSRLKSSNVTVDIKCEGNCSGTQTLCKLGEGRFGSGNDYITCSCPGCRMIVTRTENGISTSTVLPESMYEVQYLQALDGYLTEQYNGVSWSILEYRLQEGNGMYVETYTLDSGDGRRESVVLAGEINSISGKVTVYDCRGTCECREIYSFSSNTVSCSCSSCDLRVTVVKKNGSSQ
jgi:hypothetical protein